MNWFKNLNATPRLMSSFGVLLVLTLGISYLAISNLSKANDRVDSLYHEDLVGSTRADGITIDVTTIRGDDLNAMYHSSDSTAVAAAEKDELAMIAELHVNLDEADKLFVTKKGIEQLGIIRRALPEYERAQGDLFNALRGKNIAAADAALAIAVQNRAIILGASDVARTLKSDHAEEQFQTNGQAYQTTRSLMLSATVISLILGIILSIVIARGFSLPLGKAVEALEKVADGDLTVSLDVNTKDEVGQMAEALNRAIEKLAGGSRQRHECEFVVAAASRSLGSHCLGRTGAGGKPRRNFSKPRRDHRNRAPERRQCATGQPARLRIEGFSRAGTRSRLKSDYGNGRDQRLLIENLRHHFDN
jgi:methyl-accepting chemotaxis protein